MTRRPALTPLQRGQRKENLLLASRLARGQAVIAVDELGGRADAVADSVDRLCEWASNPLVLTVGSAVGALLLVLNRRRVRPMGLLSWVLPAWRVGRVVAAAVASYRSGRRGV